MSSHTHLLSNCNLDLYQWSRAFHLWSRYQNSFQRIWVLPYSRSSWPPPRYLQACKSENVKPLLNVWLLKPRRLKLHHHYGTSYLISARFAESMPAIDFSWRKHKRTHGVILDNHPIMITIRVTWWWCWYEDDSDGVDMMMMMMTTATTTTTMMMIMMIMMMVVVLVWGWRWWWWSSYFAFHVSFQILEFWRRVIHILHSKRHVFQFEANLYSFMYCRGRRQHHTWRDQDKSWPINGY